MLQSTSHAMMSMSLICTCGTVVRRRALQPTLLRKIATGPGVTSDGPAARARHSAEEASSARPGPFPYIDSRSNLDQAPRRPWGDLRSGEKVARTLANSSKAAFVVVFGLGISGLVIYAVSSELFATNSPTKLFEQASERVKRNPEVNQILQQPLKCHSELGGGRRHRRIQSSISLDSVTGRELLTMRFYVEGHLDEDLSSLTWAERGKRWIRPIVVEPSDPTDLLPQMPTHSQPHTNTAPITGAYESDWSFISIAKRLFGSFFASSPASSNKLTTKPLRTRPAKGTYTKGEVFATFLMDGNGSFQPKSIAVFYPDAVQKQWRTDIMSGKDIRQESAPAAGTASSERYRFWSRKSAS